MAHNAWDSPSCLPALGALSCISAERTALLLHWQKKKLQLATSLLALPFNRSAR